MAKKKKKATKAKKTTKSKRVGKVARRKPGKKLVKRAARSRAPKAAKKAAKKSPKKAAKKSPERSPRNSAKKAPSVKRRAAGASARRRTGAGPRTPAGLSDLERSPWSRGAGPESGGQSGDIEGLTRSEIADSESVEELVEEGQAFEAGIVDAVENAPDADEGEIRTREVPEDDVPDEYRDED